jgi:hypothetical protein
VLTRFRCSEYLWVLRTVAQPNLPPFIENQWA